MSMDRGGRVAGVAWECFRTARRGAAVVAVLAGLSLLPGAAQSASSYSSASGSAPAPGRKSAASVPVSGPESAPVSGALAVPASPTAPSPEGDAVLLGHLIPRAGKAPEFRSQGKVWMLDARSSYIMKTLADKRIATRSFRLEGHAQPGGIFEIDRFYTIHHNELYKVRFYCPVCHITYMQPGRCVCCQGKTDLKEIPASDTDE